MHKIAIRILATLLCFHAGNAYALTGLFLHDLLWVDLDKPNVEFVVTINNAVSDGCWPNASAAKTAIESTIRNSGRKVAEKGKAGEWVIVAHASGYALGDKHCAAAVSVSAYGADVVKLERGDLKALSYTHRALWTPPPVVLTGPKAEFGPRIQSAILTNIAHFLKATEENSIQAQEEIILKTKTADEKDMWGDAFDIW